MAKEKREYLIFVQSDEDGSNATIAEWDEDFDDIGVINPFGVDSGNWPIQLYTRSECKKYIKRAKRRDKQADLVYQYGYRKVTA